MSEYARVEFDSVTVVALNRHGGASLPPFDSLNLGNYVGDNPEAVQANWQIVQDTVSADALTLLHAEHGTKVNLALDPGEAPAGDGLICTKPKHAIAALSADCVPFALVDPVNQVIAVGHAGWKGVLADLMAALTQSFKSQGGIIATSTAVIGPSICPKCYEVPADRVNLFRPINPAAIYDYTHLDLSAAVRKSLSDFGFEINQIAGCNFEDDNLFSYRRANGEPTGRGGLVAVIN